MNRLYDTAAAVEWLAAHGVTRSPLTMRKLRVTGGGPSFRRLGGGRPYYTEDALVAWIESRLSPPYASTSEADARTPGAA